MDTALGLAMTFRMGSRHWDFLCIRKSPGAGSNPSQDLWEWDLGSLRSISGTLA